MAKVYFAFGIHNHQPVGNFDFVFEDAYQHSYLPFLQILEKHPGIRIAQHFSGILFDWIFDHHPDYIKRLARLVQAGQIEMITGAHYEPILMTIPDRDKIGQIEKLTATIERHTRYRARGLWLAERVWEPHLPKVLREAGVEYTIVDDAHFKYAGLQEEQLSGYYVTEEQGAPLYIFPISEKLRYTIPFQPPEATLDYFRQLASRGPDQVAIFADDGEKFGVWPGTYEHVFANQWLEQFFTAIEEAGDWVEMLHFSEVLQRVPPRGRVYLPTASYREMMEWALPFQATRELEDFENRLKELQLFDHYGIYVRGGFWRNFLAKYPESNRMHKKMLYVSEKINRYSQILSAKDRQQALDHLWAAQCNCPYWHGVFGGLYLPHLRHAIYQNLIRAETILDRYLEKKGVHLAVFDLTGTGREDLVIETQIFNLYLDPFLGGNIFELDYKPAAVNLVDTMTRREEAYHRKLVQANQTNSPGSDAVASIHDLVMAKEENLHEHLHYDWYGRNALIDHFLTSETTLPQFASSQYRELGDFVLGEYEVQHQHLPDSVRITLTRQGIVVVEQEEFPMHLTKRLRIKANSHQIRVEYRIKNLSAKQVELHFGVEWNIGLLAGNSHDRYFWLPGRELSEKHLASSGAVKEITRFYLIDEWQELRIGFLYDQPTGVWRFPIETVSLSEAGFERVYQNSAILSHWRFGLQPSEEKILSFAYEVETF